MMNRRAYGVRGLLLMLIAAALTLGGCAQVRNSMHAFVADCTDLARADIGVSFGTDMGAHVMVTQFLQLKSYSYEEVGKIGFGARHIGTWMEDREDAWVGLRSYGETRLDWTPLAFYAPGLQQKIEAGFTDPFEVMGESPDEIGFGAHLFIVGFKVGVRPVEILDLLSNLVLADLKHDNLSWEDRKRLHEMAEEAKAAEQAAEAQGPDAEK